MRILNQTAYPDEWLRERVEFGLAGAHPKAVRVRCDGKGLHGLTTYGTRKPSWVGVGGSIDVWLPNRLRGGRSRRYSTGKGFIGRLTDEHVVVFIVAHEAAHTRQTHQRPRTNRERHNGPETCADMAGVARLRQWLYPALKG